LIVQTDYWLGASKLFGAADSVSTMGTYVTELKYGFILINIIAHLGWAAGIAIIAAIAAFIVQLFRITSKIKNGLGFYIALSSSTMLAIKFVTGILMNFALMPFGTCYIPFLSYQGSGYIVDMILLGTVLSVWRYNRIFSRAPEVKTGNNVLTVKIKELISPYIKKFADYIYYMAGGDSGGDNK